MFSTKKELTEILKNRTDDMEYVAVVPAGSDYVHYYTIPKQKELSVENDIQETKIIEYVFERCESLYKVTGDEMKLVWKNHSIE